MFKQIALFVLPLLLAAACQKSSDSPTQPPTPADKVFQREMPHFSKRIKQVNIHWRTPSWTGIGWDEAFRHTTYFYDQKGRVDSTWLNLHISGWGMGSKIVYGTDGRVERLLRYDNHGKLSTELFYAYNEKGLVESYGKQGSQNPTNFRYNEAGFLTRIWVTGGDDRTILTLENNNPVKTQRFYNQGGKEHYLYTAKFDEGWNPLYLAGLYDVFPGECTPNNSTFGQIVHWDCADYDSSPRTRILTYDSEGLLLKVEDTLGDYWEDYIYE